MAAWLLRTAASSVVGDLQNSKFRVRSAKAPAFRPGDDVVLLGGSGKSMSFDYSARILTVTSTTSDDALSITTATVDGWRPLPEATTLGLLQFSLTAVNNLERPDLHFRRAYRRLPLTDFETIKSGEPFAERSAYYLLLRALPTSLREAFEQELMAYGLQRAGARALQQRLQLLLDFVYTRVLSVGQILQQLDTLIVRHESLSALDGTAVAHEFCEPDVHATDNLAAGDDIHLQAARFREFQESVRELLAPDINLESGDRFAAVVQRSVSDVQSAPAQRRFSEVFPNG